MTELAQVKLCSDSQCNRKGQLLPVSEFHLNRAHKSGRNPHCKECHCRRVAEHRDRLRVRKALRRTLEVDPEPMKIEKTQAPEQVVLAAITNGQRTREEIEAATELDEDVISDALAELYDADTVKIRRVRGEAEFHLAA